ncbi:60S ribosomal protein L24 [Anaeramoeba ignava]|uniref:60S ribosomal protein L24 n=1 Tax=Anaeramoeba ignava TaxID=1746090 RepID=A0A9Q0RE06_ANAIG|nr:60S ribosomal protein L24 [Anaeramoeba ignava]
MKLEICSFSGTKIVPGRGMRFVRSDGKSFIFFSKKCYSLFDNKKNPRKIAWTQFYRRIHKKNEDAFIKKKKTRRVQKYQRGIEGASIEQIKARRQQKPEVRQQLREEAIKELKARKQQKEEQRKKLSQQKKKVSKDTKVAQKISNREKKKMQKSQNRGKVSQQSGKRY